MLKIALLLLSLILVAKSNPVGDLPTEDLMLGKYYQGDISGINLDLDAIEKGIAQIPNSNYGLWTNRIVPYIFAPKTYTAQEQETIRQGMRMIESTTCIRFTPATSAHSVYLRIYSGQGCFSQVGMRRYAGAQDLSLQRGGCVAAGVAAHELIHALGFFHEQSRPDRDQYLTIYWQNIDPSMRYNFDIMRSVDTLGFPYDYQSIMQYQTNAFSINGQPTMVPRQPGVVIQNAAYRSSISKIDVGEIRALYRC